MSPTAETIHGSPSAAVWALPDVVALSAWFSGTDPPGAEPPDEQEVEPAPELPEVERPLPSSPDLIESGPTLHRRQHPAE